MSRQVYLHLSCGSQIFEASLHLWKRNFPSIQIYKWMKPYHSTSLLAFSMAIRGHETYMMTAVRLESESIPFFYAPWLHFRNDWCSRERGTQLCFSWLWTKKLCTLSMIKPIFKMYSMYVMIEPATLLEEQISKLSVTFYKYFFSNHKSALKPRWPLDMSRELTAIHMEFSLKIFTQKTCTNSLTPIWFRTTARSRAVTVQHCGCCHVHAIFVHPLSDTDSILCQKISSRFFWKKISIIYFQI